MGTYSLYILLFGAITIFNLGADVTVEALRIPKDVGEKLLAEPPEHIKGEKGNKPVKRKNEVVEPYLEVTCASKNRGKFRPGDIGYNECLNEGENPYKDDPYLGNRKDLEMGIIIRK